MLAFLLVSVGAGLYFITGPYLGSEPVRGEREKVPFHADGHDFPSFSFILLETQDTRRRLVFCRQKRCRLMGPVVSENVPAVTDGRSWYHYQDGSLRRTWINEERSELIVDRTPLVSPRGLIISPDNKKVAYWLDNTDKPEKKLTELWVYDSTRDETKLLAEKLFRPDINTKARWNKASNLLWFIGNGDQVHVVSLQPPSLETRFKNTDWSELEDMAESVAMDISEEGSRLAYARPSAFGRSEVITVEEGSYPEDITVRGSVSYLQWLNDGSLLYVVQGQYDYTFWLAKNSVRRRLARQPGTFESARTDPREQVAVFAGRAGRQPARIFALNIRQGSIIELDYAARDAGAAAYVVHVESLDEKDGAVAGITQPLDDGQLVAFIDSNLPDIVRQTNVQPERLTITDQPNTVYVDYRDGTGVDKRLLLTVNDAVHTEWSAVAYFEESSGEWVKTQGGGLTDPKPRRLYEWETGLKRWILKEEY